MSNQEETPNKVKFAQYLILGLVLVVMVYTVLLWRLTSFHEKEAPKANYNAIDSITDDQYAVQEFYDQEIESLRDSIILLKSKILENRNTITTLKSKKDEKVNDVANANSDELLKFLTDRYKDSTSAK